MNPEKRKATLIAKYGSWEAYKEQQVKHGAKGGKIGGSLSPANFKRNKQLAAEAGEKGRQTRYGKK